MGQTSSTPKKTSKESPKKVVIQSELISQQAYHQTLDQQNTQLKQQLEIVNKYSATIPKPQKQIQQLIETNKQFEPKQTNKNYRNMIFTAEGELKKL
jgi:hypothetical protein